MPPARLKIPWDAAKEFTEREKRWEAIENAYPVDGSAEYWAAEAVFDSLIDPGLARLPYKSPGVCSISDIDGLSRLLDVDPAELRSDLLSFEDGEDLIVPWSVTEKVARRCAELNTDPILRHVLKEEAEQRKKMIHGEWHRATRYEPERHTSAEFFAEIDEQPYHRPCRDVLRQWCGSETVQRWDELGELRKEVHRLGLLTKNAVDTLRKAGLNSEAARVERELGVTVGELRGS